MRITSIVVCGFSLRLHSGQPLRGYSLTACGRSSLTREPGDFPVTYRGFLETSLWLPREGVSAERLYAVNVRLIFNW